MVSAPRLGGPSLQWLRQPLIFSFCFSVLNMTMMTSLSSIPKDFKSISTVPDSHTWTDDFICTDQVSIPIINLTDANASKLIVDACHTWGVFQITGHGIPSQVVELVVFEARRLFNLPTEEKQKALRPPGGRTGYGVSNLSKFLEKGLWHEGFTIIGSPLDQAKALWPHHYQPFCDVMEDYGKLMNALAATLTRLILKEIPISEEAMNWIDTANIGALQLNSYPICPNPDKAMGLAAHTDTSFLTILHQTTITEGLQIFKRGVGWVSVNPVSGAFVVNVGDLLDIVSNGHFPSAVHRVMVNNTKHRLSVVYFYGAPEKFDLSASEKVLEYSGGIPLYRPVSVGEYVSIKMKNLDKFPLSLISI